MHGDCHISSFFRLEFIGLEIYSDKLIKEGIVTPEDVKNVRDKYEKICEEAFELAKKETHIKVSMDWSKQGLFAIDEWMYCQM